MLKKLWLAAVVAAMLMTGAARGAEWTSTNGTTWTGTAPATAQDTAYGILSSVDMTELDTDTTFTGAFAIGGGSGGSLVIGGASNWDGTAAVTGGKTIAQITGDLSFGSSAGALRISRLGDFRVTGGLDMSNAASSVNAGTLTVGGTFKASASNALTNTGTINFNGTFNANTTGKLINAGTGKIFLDDGDNAAGLALLLKNGDNGDIGTITIADSSTGLAVFDLTSMSSATLTTGTVKIDTQTKTASNVIKIVGANLELNGGTFSGAITAKDVTFKSGVTDLATLSATGKRNIESGATVDFGTAAIGDTAAKTVTNEGTIRVSASETLTINDYYAGTDGTINNGGTGVVITTTAANAAGDLAALTALKHLAAGSSDGTAAKLGDIGTVTLTNKLAAGSNIDIAATDGKLTLGTAQDVAIDVKVGGADLMLDGTGSHLLKDVAAAAITADSSVGATFNGSVTADSVTTNGAAMTFAGTTSGATSTIGALTTSNTGNVEVSGGKVTINGLTFATGTLSNTGGELIIDIAETGTLAGHAGTPGLLVLDGANGKAKTTLVGKAAVLLADVANNTTSIGTVNVNGDVGNKAIALGSVTAPTTAKSVINFNAKQTTYTNAINVGAAAINLNEGASGSIFNNAITTTGITTIADGATITFGKGAAASFAGTGAVAVATGGTMVVGSDGLTASAAGGITVADGATLAFDGGTLAMGGKALALDKNSTLELSDAVLAAASSTATVAPIITGATAVTVTGASAPKLDAYLESQSYNGILNEVKFMRESGVINYSVVEQTAEGAAAAIAENLAENGAAGMAGVINSSNAVTGWVNVIRDFRTSDGDYTVSGDSITSAQGAQTAGLLNEYFNSSTPHTSAQVQSVASTLSGYNAAKSLDVAVATSGGVSSRINSRVAQNNLARASISGNDALASTILNSSLANRVWAGGFGLWEDAEQRGADLGYKYKSGGLITGYDRVFGPITLGGSFAYTAGSYENKNTLQSDGDIDSYAFNLYGTYNHCSGFFATLMGGYTYSDYNLNDEYATGLWDSADFHADTWSIGTTLGYDFRPMQNLTITPSVGLYYYTSATSTYNTNVLRGVQVDQDSTELPIDVAVNYDIPTAGGNVRLTANAGYAYNFSSDGGDLGTFGYNGITGVGVTGVQGREASKHTFNLGAGVSYSTGRFEFGVKYDYYTKSDYDAHRVLGTVGVNF